MLGHSAMKLAQSEATDKHHLATLERSSCKPTHEFPMPRFPENMRTMTYWQEASLNWSPRFLRSRCIAWLSSMELSAFWNASYTLSTRRLALRLETSSPIFQPRPRHVYRRDSVNWPRSDACYLHFDRPSALRSNSRTVCMLSKGTFPADYFRIRKFDLIHSNWNVWGPVPLDLRQQACLSGNLYSLMTCSMAKRRGWPRMGRQQRRLSHDDGGSSSRSWTCSGIARI